MNSPLPQGATAVLSKEFSALLQQKMSRLTLHSSGEQVFRSESSLDFANKPKLYKFSIRTSASFSEENFNKARDTRPRGKWSSHLEFLLACASQCVGVGNIIRFPYLCYHNGGGTFVLAYFLSAILVGIPIYIMELALGQWLGVGGLKVWFITPVWKGVGYAAAMMSVWLSTYYTVTLAWAMFYLFTSFTTFLPWASCNNSWNTANCSVEFQYNLPLVCFNGTSTFQIDTKGEVNVSDVLKKYPDYNCTQLSEMTQFISPAEEYWQRHVLHISSGVDSPGQLRVPLVFCLLSVWVVIYFCIWKGIRWMGKVVYFTCIVKYLLLIILLIRGVSLSGAIDGIKIYILPDITALKNPRVWVEAASQVVLAHGVGLGSIIAIGSYSVYCNNVFRDAIIVSITESSTSLVSGLAIFSIIGFLAQRQRRHVTAVLDNEPALPFLVFPHAVTEIPASPLWSALLFVMLILFGIDTQCLICEGLIVAIIDEFPKILRRYREIFIAGVIVLLYLLGLSCITEGGIYVYTLMDAYVAGGVALLIIVFFECIAIGWSYGVDNFYDNLRNMLGFYPCFFCKICWMVVTPLTIAIAVFLYILTNVPVKYNNYEFPQWAHILGICISVSSLGMIPTYLVYKIIFTPGPLRERLPDLFRPDVDTAYDGYLTPDQCFFSRNKQGHFKVQHFEYGFFSE